MINRSYLVKMSAGETDSSRVWNSRKPLMVGGPMRWVVEQADGGVRIRSLAPVDALSKKVSREHFVKHSEIEKAASILLAPGEKNHQGFRLELRLVNSVDAAFMNPESIGNALRIFFCKGDWAIESTELMGSYIAKLDGKKVFKLKGNSSGFFTKEESLELEALTDGVKHGKTDLKKGEKRFQTFGQLAGTVISYDHSEWRLAAYQKDTSPTIFAAPLAVDAEVQIIKKTLQGALAASLLMGLVAWFLPSTPAEKQPETVRILLTQKKKTVKGFMTAAPKGDPKASDFSIGKNGNAKNAGKKGNKMADVKNTKVSPAGKPKPAAKVAAKAPAKAPAKSSHKASTRVASKPAASAKKARIATVASRPVAVPRSELFKALSSSSFRKTSAGLVSGGVTGASGQHADSAAEARSLGASGGGSSRGALGGAGGVSTRSASVSGFGGGGSGNGDGGPGSAGAGYGRGSYSKVSGQGKSFVSMDTGASDVEDGLTRDQVGKVIHAHWNEVRYCHEAAALRSPGLGGKLTAQFSIGASGSVQVANVGNSTVGDRAFHDCIMSRLKGWKFPKPKGGVTVGVAYPFMFKSLTR